MAYDVVIRDGRVVDGSGFGSYRADVGIVDGVVACVGRIRERGRQEIDAEGHVVTPGVHRRSHAPRRAGVLGSAGRELVLARGHDRGDGQLRLHPGAGARRRTRAGGAQPRARRGHRPRGAGAGIEWGWETFPEYLDAVDRLPKAINYAANVGHSALRTWAMGERAFEEEADRRRPRAHEGPAGRRVGGGCDRAHDVAQRAPRDVGRPAGRVAAGRVGGAVRARRRDGRRRHRHPRRWQRARAVDRPRATRAGAQPDARPGGRDGRADDDGHHRHQSGRLRDARPHRPGRGGRRAHDRPVALPRHQRAAVVRDPAAVRPAARSGTTSARCPTTSSSRALRDPAVRERSIRRRHGGRLLARGAASGRMPRKPDFDGIRVYEHGLPPNPTINEVAAAAWRDAGRGDDRPRDRDRPRAAVHPAQPLPAGSRRPARGHAPPAHGDDVLRLRRAPQPDRRLVDPHAPARPLGARPAGVHARGGGPHAHARARDGVGVRRPRPAARGHGRRPQRVRPRARRAGRARRSCATCPRGGNACRRRRRGSWRRSSAAR